MSTRVQIRQGRPGYAATSSDYPRGITKAETDVHASAEFGEIRIWRDQPSSPTPYSARADSLSVVGAPWIAGIEPSLPAW
jgi:hypothetical protein